jgi:hypothetical protein
MPSKSVYKEKELEMKSYISFYMVQSNGSWTECKMTQLHPEQNSTASGRYSRADQSFPS